MKKQAKKQEKISLAQASKSLCPNYRENCYETIKETDNPIEKQTEDFNKHFIKENIQMVNNHMKSSYFHCFNLYKAQKLANLSLRTLKNQDSSYVLEGVATGRRYVGDF